MSPAPFVRSGRGRTTPSSRLCRGRNGPRRWGRCVRSSWPTGGSRSCPRGRRPRVWRNRSRDRLSRERRRNRGPQPRQRSHRRLSPCWLTGVRDKSSSIRHSTYATLVVSISDSLWAGLRGVSAPPGPFFLTPEVYQITYCLSTYLYYTFYKCKLGICR
jgi:hypothetical protein